MTEEQATALVDGVGAPGRPGWDTRLETGVPTIDLQHRILFVRQDLPMIGALRQHTDQLSASP